MTKKTFAEFFAGVGLVHEGLRRGAWQCVWANDISPEKQASYLANFSADHGAQAFQLGDVWQYAEQPDAIPSACFLYTASFPCTDLSLAGDRQGLAGVQSGSLHALLAILAAKSAQNSAPELIMLENVQGFLTSHQGTDIANTLRALDALGYAMDLIEVDAAHFTPQSRPRVFLFAIKQALAGQIMRLKDIGANEDAWWQAFAKNPALRTARIQKVIRANPAVPWGLFDIPLPPVRTTRLSDVLETELADDAADWWDTSRKQHLYQQMFARHQTVLLQMQQADAYSYGTIFRRTRDGVPRAELRSDGIAGCLRTPRGGSSQQILLRAGHGRWDLRLLTPREYARLQGVRDNYILPSTRNQAYFAMADAVCVPVIEFICRHVLTPSYAAWQRQAVTLSASPATSQQPPP